jgi:hypothetical protein
VAAFDGDKMASDPGGLLLGPRIGRSGRSIGSPSVSPMVARIFALVLGYEDFVDHDELRHDPTMAVLAGKLSARRKNCAPLAGKTTLNWVELGGPALRPAKGSAADPCSARSRGRKMLHLDRTGSLFGLPEIILELKL